MLVKPLRERTITLYHDAFGGAPVGAASAPGSVEVIGGHTDYNGGPVLMIATRERTIVAVGQGELGVLEGVTSGNGRQERIDLREGPPAGWLAVVAGVLRELGALGAVSEGARVVVASEIAEDHGLASHTAFAVATAKALAALNRLALTTRQLAGVAFRAGSEHGTMGRGITEYASAALAQADHALLIECASAETRRVPLDVRMLLVETDTPGGADALLASRRAECDAAVRRLKMDLPELQWLASWPAAWLARLKRALSQPLRSRAVHVVGETARTRFAAELLVKGRSERFGELLYESHESCRRLFDVSTPQGDLIVAAARRAGALGARLTSAGSGGTVVVILGKGERARKREEGRGKGEAKVVAAIQQAYAKAFGREAVIKAVRPGDGVRSEPVRSAR